jgi:hypothetical protein
VKPLPLFALVCIITGFASHTQAMTERECIRIAQVSTHCHWSKATGGRRDGWFDTTGKKQAAGKPPKANADPSSTPMSNVANAVASAFGGTNRESSTHGSRDKHAKEVMPPGPKVLSPSDTRPRPVSLPDGADMTQDKQFHIEDWLDVFAQRERTVLRDGLLVKAQALRQR